MEGIVRSSVVVSGEFAAHQFAAHDLVAYLKSNQSVQKLSADRLSALTSNCLHVYRELFPVIKTKQAFPVTITLSDQTQLTILLEESELTITTGDNQVASIIPTRIVLDSLYSEVRTTREFFEITQQEDRYRALGWNGNFYYKNLPTPEQLQEDYKQTPYMTIGEDDPVNLNGAASFSETNPLDSRLTQIVCRHLSVQCIEDVKTDPTGRGKLNFDHYNNRESLTNHVSVETELLFARLRKDATSYDLIDNDRFGEHIQTCFRKMQATFQSQDISDGASNIKTLLVESTTHAMMVRLRMKHASDGRLIYVVKFYDPNTTNKAVRVETDDLSTFKLHTLKRFIAGSDSPSCNSNYFSYFNDDDQICMVMDCDLNRPPNTERTLSSAPKGSITPHYIYYLLAYNLSSDLIGLTSQLEAIGKESPSRLVELLAAKTRDGAPGTFMMSRQGDTEGIKAMCELTLKLSRYLSPDQLMELFTAKRVGGATALFLMGQEGHAEEISIVGELILKLKSVLSSDQLVELFAAKNDDGVSVLTMMGYQGHVAAMKAIGELILALTSTISADQLMRLIAANDYDGVSALLMMVQEGHAGAIKAYGGLVEQSIPVIPAPKKLVEQIGIANENGTRLLYKLMECGDALSIAAVGELLLKFKRYITVDQLIDVLAAKGAGGTPGLYVMVENNFDKATLAFKEVVFSLLSYDDREMLFAIIEEVNEIDTPELYERATCGSDEVKEITLKVYRAMRQLMNDWDDELAE